MKASIIIPTLNAAGNLSGLLNTLSAQSMHDFEIIIIDSQSDDMTMKIATSSGIRVRTVLRWDFSHGGTRNIAAQEASGEYLVFLTQDVLPVNEHLLESLLSPMDLDRKIAVAYGRQIAYRTAPVIEKLFRRIQYPEIVCTRDKNDISEQGVRTFFCSNTCAAYRRETFLQLGMFKDDTIMNEDMEFAYRAIVSGYKVHYAAEAMVWHSHRYSMLQQFRRYVDIGVFFENNKHLASLSRNESEGRKYLVSATSILARKGEARAIVHLFLDSAARYAGYTVGYRNTFLPLKLMRFLSMNRNYWSKLLKSSHRRHLSTKSS